MTSRTTSRWQILQSALSQNGYLARGFARRWHHELFSGSTHTPAIAKSGDQVGQTPKIIYTQRFQIHYNPTASCTSADYLSAQAFLSTSLLPSLTRAHAEASETRPSSGESASSVRGREMTSKVPIISLASRLASLGSSSID